MVAFLDLTGKTFGRLVVISVAGKNRSGNYKWLVECECGNKKEIPSDHLVRERQPVMSCGCYRNDRIREACCPNPDQVAFNLLFLAYKKRARLKKLEFGLDVDEFRNLTGSDCHYCGAPPAQEMRNKPKTGLYVYNGVDKIDPNGNYTISNCVPCCKKCNYMKGTLSVAEFLSHVSSIYCYGAGK